MRKVEDGLILNAGGEQCTNGIALVLHEPFDRAYLQNYSVRFDRHRWS